MKKVVTQESVSAAANALIAEGLEPSVIAVQERTKGSYTTVKPYLEAWDAERKRMAAIAPQVPVELLKRGGDFVTEIYAAASQKARAEAALERDEARQERDRALAALRVAEGEVGRLELLERGQAEKIDEQSTIIQAQEIRHAALEASATAVKDQFDRVRSDIDSLRDVLAGRERELAELRANNQPALVEQLQAMQRQLDGMAAKSPSESKSSNTKGGRTP